MKLFNLKRRDGSSIALIRLSFALIIYGYGIECSKVIRVESNNLESKLHANISKASL